MTTAAVLLNHNSGDDLTRCLDSLRGQVDRVVVVDNASTDGSEAVARQRDEVELVVNTTNRGFAVAANQGVAASGAEVVFLVNPDATVSAGVVDALRATLDRQPRAALIGADVRNPDGSSQPTKRSFPGLWHAALHATVGLVWPNNPGTRAYVLADETFTQPRTVDWVAATAVAIRREAFDAVGGFDERFFFFVEDVDLCRRLWDAGWEVWFQPGATVEHRWGGSWTKRPLRFLWIHHVNLWRYVRKHKRGAWLVVYPFIAAGLAVRFSMLALRWLVTRRAVPGHRRMS